MKKIAVLFALLIALVGCSNDNKITISNISSGAIYFNFRAYQYVIEIDSAVTINEIPNGTYTYATTYTVPAGAKTWDVKGDAAAGQISFEKKNTQVLLIYSGAVTAELQYILGCTMTTTNSSSAAAPIGP